MNDFDLSALASTPVPDLARPDQVRARGEQRRRRGHVLVAGAAALVVALGAGTAVALVDGGRPDALLPADPSPTVAPTEPTLDDDRLATSARLLTPGDASRVAGGTWTAGAVADDPGLGLIVCPTGDGYAGAGTRRSLTRDGLSLDTHVVVQTEAEQWVAGIQEEVRACPRRAADSEDGKASSSFELVDVAPGASLAFPLAAVKDTSRDCDTCRAHVQYWLVVARDDYLSFTTVDASEQPRLLDWARTAYDRLGDPVSPAPTPSPTPYVSPVPVTLGPLDERSFVEENRIGPVEVGMTIEEAEAAAEQDLRQEGDVLGSCVYYAPSSGKPDVSFMVIDGVVSRIDVDSGTTTTNNNDIGIGSTEAEVKAAYRGTVVSKHPYTDGHYLRVLSEDGRFALLFETDGTKVTSFRSGYPDAVDQVEGCA